MAIIIEHTAGKFPFWISPRQVCVIPLHPTLNEYATQLSEQIYQAGFEAKADVGTDMFKQKLVTAFSDKYNFVLVVGDKDKEKGGATVQGRTMAAFDKITEKPEKYQKFMPIEEIIAMMKQIDQSRTNM